MKVDKANFRANARQADAPNPANCPVRGVKVDGVNVGESGQTRERGLRHLVGPNEWKGLPRPELAALRRPATVNWSPKNGRHEVC